MTPTPNTQAEPTTQALIEACDKHAAHYVDDPRQDIVTDVRNAFFAGAKYSTPPAPPAADVAGLVAELGRLLAKITAPEGNYTASDRTEFTMQMLNGINKLAALAQPKQPNGVNYHAHYVLVNKAALQMVRNALRNDVERGLAARGEMLEELDGATFACPPDRRPAQCSSLCAESEPCSITEDGACDARQPARVELPPLSDAEYRRGYRDGYNRRDDEVKGALA